MPTFLRSYVKPLLHKLGVDVVRYRGSKHVVRIPPDFDANSTRIFRAVEPFTMTSPERIYTLLRAVEYLVRAGVPGDFVECGVWRGGSAMAMALSLLELGDSDRLIHLYDTFSGMIAPTEIDVSIHGTPANVQFQRTRLSEHSSTWCRSSLEAVTRNVLSTGYPKTKFQFVEGKVEDTMPNHIPQRIALLRLDTDWYESTKHEMTHLFPRLATGGVLIIDDYGYWAGARKAVDEYFAENRIHLLLNRIDHTARIGVKQ